ncbi:MAG: hypothetical protein BGO37_11670 [Cellulomonas sp. 73-92]|nr:MAG: hypothetical protein BGO37_11670 [Cellulomonas sp. 73-92]
MVEVNERPAPARRIELGTHDGPGGCVVVSGAGVRLDAELCGRAVVTMQLGIVVDGVDLALGSDVVDVRRERIEDSWIARSGKSTGVLPIRQDQTEIRLRHAGGRSWQIVIRCAADGIAVRYAIDDLEGVAWLEADGTVLRPPAGTRAWVQDYQTWYETPRYGADLEALEPGAYGLPVLLRLGPALSTDYLLLSESAIDGRYSGAHATVAADGTIGLVLADDKVEIARGALTPWRVLLLGTLAAVVESRLVDELAPPPSAALEAAEWVRPGRAAWSWWSDFYSGAQLDTQRHFVDRAAEFGWEHLLIDCGWEETWVPDIVAYASHRGVQVHLWTVWHDLDGPEKLARLALWRSWGVAGIKVDFMESESKDRYRWYDTILAESARLGLMVNFHGSVIPRGWVRTWPQVVGYEAVRGSEYYVFYSDAPLTAVHNVALPFTRNVLGAMDFTPVAWSAKDRTTSDGHELAQAVVFESGITHFADSVDVYAASVHATSLLSELPATWDETRLLGGSPDTEAVLARRHGDRWFVGAVAVGPARTLRVPLGRLGDGPWQAWIVDDDPAGGLRGRAEVVQGNLTVDVAENGGCAAILAPPASDTFRARRRPVLAAPVVEPARGGLDDRGEVVLTVSTKATLRTPPGWSADDLGDGRWRVTAPARRRTGDHGIVTVEEPGEDGVPNIAHARLVVPLTAGRHVVSRLPMLGFRNESGPVERDMSNGGGNPRDGVPMRIASIPAADGFGVSTPSEIVLALDGHATRFTVDVGVDDETPTSAASAEVLGDGRALVRVSVSGGAPAVPLDVDVTGIDTLTLRTLPEDVDDSPAHVDWANARVLVPTSGLHTTPHPGR